MSGSHGVHLIGSVPLADTEAVFRAVTAELGPWLKRIPDGETGDVTDGYFDTDILLAPNSTRSAVTVLLITDFDVGDSGTGP